MEAISSYQETRGQEKVYAPGLCFAKIFWVFIVGSLIGTWYEELLAFYQLGRWESRAGLVLGPFNPVYGAGFAIIVIFLCRRRLPWTKLILLGSFLGGTIEYAFSFLQETFTGTKSWDYSQKFLNIHGRTTLLFAIFWGCCALGIVKVIYPLISSLVERIPFEAGRILTPLLVAFFIFNSLLTAAALMRQHQRRQDIAPNNIIAEFLDYFYDDDKMRSIYPNMDINCGHQNYTCK